MNNTLQKRGRKSGSSDSVNVSLETLLKYMPATAAVPVRRKWLENFEQFYNVSIVSTVQPERVEATNDPEKERTADEKDVVIRQRLEIAEEELS